MKFTADKKVIWNSGAPEGSWSVEKDTIRATINNMRYELKGNVFTKEAVVVVPYRKPASKMVQIGKEVFLQNVPKVYRGFHLDRIFDRNISLIKLIKCQRGQEKNVKINNTFQHLSEIKKTIFYIFLDGIATRVGKITGFLKLVYDISK